MIIIIIIITILTITIMKVSLIYSRYAKADVVVSLKIMKSRKHSVLCNHSIYLPIYAR